MSSVFGKNLKVSIFGESHGQAIGAVIDGLPAGEEIDREELCVFMARRAPGGGFATPRKESDLPEFISGIYTNEPLAAIKTTGAPVCIIIENKNARSSDYAKLNRIPRPGHADFTAWLKYKGFADMRGGGHFSGRLTAPLCAAGGIALQILKRRGVSIGSHIASIGEVNDSFFGVGVTKEQLAEISAKSFPVIDAQAGEKMKALIKSLDGDSVGGVIECCAVGVPAGLGGGIYGLESSLAAILFGIPAVKGVEFGSGFEGSGKLGSQNNDRFIINGGEIVTKTNNHGGILGGITTGMPLVFRIALKPTPSIALEQDSVDIDTLKSVKLEIGGRHDPCIAVRAAPVAEAVAALVVLDEMMCG
ncbi:MAG: chorismate synthase [Oscillospiraceae bacterium]|nr:chorismate synthase [Oscillospiraceae bacterium]